MLRDHTLVTYLSSSISLRNLEIIAYKSRRQKISTYTTVPFIGKHSLTQNIEVDVQLRIQTQNAIAEWYFKSSLTT